MDVESDSEAEEEIVVFAEVDGSLEFGNYGNVHVLGIECRNPVVQMDDKFFTGTYESALGTFMFFAEDEIKPSSDPVFNSTPEKPMKLVHTTDKYLTLKQAYIMSKKEPESSIQSVDPTTENNVEILNFATQEEAIAKLKPLLDEIKDDEDIIIS